MFWAEMTGDQFEPARERARGVCLLPLSCLERHAHHLPLGTDMYIVRELCRRAAALEPAVIFPDFVFTQIQEARHCPGTIALEAGLLPRLLNGVCREIARNGFGKIVLVNGHGGNNDFLRFFAQSQLAGRRDYVVYLADPPLLPDDAAEFEKLRETEVDGHAGEIETSAILAIRPDLVARDRLRAGTEGMPRGRLEELRAAGVYTGIWWYADHPTHYRGDGIPATAEKGECLLNAMARALADAVRLIKRDEEARRLQDEFFAAAEGRGLGSGRNENEGGG